MTDYRKTVLITGCSPGGIGHALAREFHDQGLRVFATVRGDVSSIADLTALGIEGLSLTVDHPESISALKSEVEKRTGGALDILINNAGQYYSSPALDQVFDIVHRIFEVNTISVMRMCQTFAPLLVKAKGTIVQIGTVSAFIPYVFDSTYSASKAALHAYSNTLRVELAPFGVRVTNVVTGAVKSTIVSRQTLILPPRSLYTPVLSEWQATYHTGENPISAEKYAKQVVAKIMKKNPPKEVWAGSQAGFVKFVTTCLPDVVLTWYFRDKYGIAKLSNPDGKKTA